MINASGFLIFARSSARCSDAAGTTSSTASNAGRYVSDVWPLAVVGVYWTHYLTGYDLDPLGFVGIVILIGVVVNNGIVLIDRIEIERTRDEVKVVLHVARPGLIIGKKGQEVELLQEELQNLIGRRVNLKIEEISRPEMQAQLVAEKIAEQLSKRASFRRTMKRALEETMEAGAKGPNPFATFLGKCLIGMRQNETKQFNVPRGYAFGPVYKDRIFKLPLKKGHGTSLGDDIKIKISHQ